MSREKSINVDRKINVDCENDAVVSDGKKMIMFSESLRKKIARVMAWVFLFTNVSPAFAMHVPDYNVRVERREILNPVTGAMVSGFLIEAQKLMTQTVEMAAVQAYQTVFSQVVAPFMMMAATVQLGMAASLQEILQKAKAEAQIFGSTTEPVEGESGEAEGTSEEVHEIETQISRGFCLSIPELGDLLISHDGDVVFDTQKALGKTLRISAPSQVVLNNTTAKEIDVEATAAILTGKAKSKIDSLHFRGIGGSEILTNGLFIDKESELQVGNLSLESALLLNTGKLSVAHEMDLNGGYFFNTGAVATSANPSVFSNMAYLFNGATGTIDASDRLLMSATNFSNLGTVKAKSMSLVTSGLSDNRGRIETTTGFEAEGLGTFVNNGLIDGKSGSIAISGEKFEHRQGEVKASTVEFGSGETILAGSVAGQEGFFRGSVTNTGTLDFQRGVMSGLFVNSSETTKFERQLELTGERAEIQNKDRGRIMTAAIISDATTGIIDGGEVLAGQAIVKKHLQLGTRMPTLTSVTTDAGAKLLVKAQSSVPLLRKITNAGNTKIATATPELDDMQNAVTGHLQLENAGAMTRITSLDHLRGRLDLKASLPNLAKLHLQNGASLFALKEADFSTLRDVRVDVGSSLLADESSVFTGLKDIANFGTVTSKTPLMGLDSVYNAPAATMHFLAKARVQGRAVRAEDAAIVRTTAGSRGGKIGVFNEGTMLTKLQFQSGDSYETSAANFFGLDIKGGHYASSPNAIFRMESGGIRSYDFFNDGLLYSPTGLKVKQHSRVTKWGRCAAENEIECEIDTVPLSIDDSFKPIVNGSKKTLKIKSKAGVKISGNTSWNVDLDLETPTFSGDADFTVKSFKAKTTTFKNTKKLSAKDSLHVETRDFTNTSGRLQTHGNGKIIVSGLFLNTGGGRLEKNKAETITNYIWDGSQLVPQQQTFYRDVYYPDLGRAGVITAGRFLDIRAGRFDNSFGILNAAQKLDLRSMAEVCNECGLIYSGGPTTINGTLLKNGYMRGAETVSGVDPNAPIREDRSVPYNVWVQSGYKRHNGTWPFGSDEWVNTSHNETRWRTDSVLTGYSPRTQSVSASQYPGYIFSNGDLDIQMNSSAYFGTIVSGGNVKIRGVNQSSINAADRGTIVVRGNVNMELQRAALAQLALQAQNIYMNLVDDLLIRGIVQPVLMPDGSVSQLINLQQLGRQLGFLTDGSTFAEQGSTSSSPTGLVPMSLPSSSDSSSSGGFSVHPTAGAGFMGPRPSSRFFIPAMQNTVLNQLITMILTPIYGRSILLNLDSTGQLMRRGATIAETFRGTQSLILPDGDPAILFDKSSNPDVEVEIDGEKTMVPLYDSFLLTDVVSRLLNKIKAEKLLGIQSLGDIRFEPGEINLESEDIILKSKGQIQIAAQYVYNETGNRVGVNPVSLSRPGTITLSGDKGVKTQGAQISAQAIKMASSDGSIVDSEMPLDPTYSFSKTFFGGRNVTMRQKTFTSSLAATEGMSFSAPRKSIDQHGTNLITGPQGILFDAPKYTWQPAFEEMGFYHSNCDGFVKVQEKAPKMGGMQTPGAIVFKSQDTTLMGAQIIAGTVSNPVDGQFRVIPAYATQESHSLTNRSGFLSHSSLEIQQTRSVPVPTQILAEHFESLGVGVCELEGAVVRALDMTITKTLEEKAAYERSHTVITQKASGFCPPKIKGDPFIDALKGMRNVVSFGDVAPATFNLIGATAQTLNHAQMLANLSTMGNPLTTITQILTSRFIAGPSFCNIKTVTKVDESKPLQSRIETGILRVTNDRTHLEGEWDVSGRGEIDTGKFSMSAPRHTVTQTTETSGWSVSLSPAALLGAYLDPCLLTGLGCLPNVAVHESDGSSSSTSHAPTILRADDLFIRCGDAVFSGAQIHARLLEAIVTGDLTVESLADEFRSESESRDFGLCLGAIASLTQEVKPDAGFGDPRLGAVPTMRFANEDAMSLKVREVAQMVGQERFYLTVGRLLHKKGATVGLKPDGVVVRDDAERIQAGRTLEEKVHEAESHHRTVINPAIGEFVAMMNQVDDLLQLRAQITQLQMLDGVPKPEREKTNREVKEFLDKPEVKEKIAKLKVARQKQKLAAQELRRLEMEDPTLPMRMAGIMPLAKETPTTSSAKSAPKIAAKTKSPAVPPLPKLSATQLKSLAVSAKPMAKKSPTQSPAISVAQSKVLASTLSDPSNAHSVDEQMNRVFAWSQAQQENKSCGREAMEMLSSINESLDKFAVDHKNIAKVGAAIVEGIGYAAVGGALLVAAEGGILPFVLGGSTMLASNEVVATVLEHGSEYVVKEAASLGTTEAEAVRFGTNMAGTINKLMFLGATKLAVKVVKGGKGTVKTLSPKESTAISKQAFREKQTNPIEFNASVSKGISEAVEKNPLMKLEMERFADAANQRPYNSRAMESLLQARYPDTVSSHTLPGLSQPNVGLAGMHKERFIGHDPLTFEPIIQRVTFDQRGFPVFDPYVKVETRISGDLGSMRPDVHMKMATAQLKADIDAGRISRSMFNDIEWTHIQKEKPKIGTFTWHHHQETGRMQLVPTDIHDWVGHIGGNKLWGMPK